MLAAKDSLFKIGDDAGRIDYTTSSSPVEHVFNKS
jgi:hypothetical protein